MQPVKAGKVNAQINVTPLVDVVLVLLIIFMVIAPQLQSGPSMVLPTTDEPPQKPDDGRQILVAMEHGGRIWIGKNSVSADRFSQSMLDIAERKPDWQIVLKADARLTFGEVKQAMLAVEAAGFKDVGLIAERLDDAPTKHS